MTDVILRHPRFYAIQNGLAALLFGLLLLAEVSAHLLHEFPGVELFWRLASFSNLTVAPLLHALGSLVQQPILFMCLLAASIAIPLAAWRWRNWLGTAVSGHVALAALVVLTWWAMKRANTGHAMASLSDVFEPHMLNSSVASLVLLTACMGVMCVLNHIAFFKSAKSS